MGFLPLAVVVLALMVLIGFFNEKTLKLTNEIALMLFSSVIGSVFSSLLPSASIPRSIRRK